MPGNVLTIEELKKDYERIFGVPFVTPDKQLSSAEFREKYIIDPLIGEAASFFECS